MIRVLALLLLCAAPAAAEVWPQLYDVTGVAADDVLNIRAEPDAGAPILGTLAPDARGVEVIAEENGWGLVNTGEGAGWTSLRYLALHDIGPALLAPRLSCGGTEPFWDLDLVPGETAQFDLFGDKGPVHAASGLQRAYGTPIGMAFTATSGAARMTGMIEARDCSDGMSDRVYGISLGLLVEGAGDNSGHYMGCCSLQAD
ncbi:SH3 domain-containing protein [Mesobacterium pallidum]|uniref:SH3 domain-containing protein n=1 Tax=Mesobacterium pallidum TaxID=2872037 RepID=UPI001EE28662|nr:SH3 domain-containing protein [Mesobacterium pallidum]